MPHEKSEVSQLQKQNVPLANMKQCLAFHAESKNQHGYHGLLVTFQAVVWFLFRVDFLMGLEMNCLNVFEHSSQVNGFLPVFLNLFSHFKQLKGFSLVWTLSCVLNLPGCLKFLSHFEQLNGMSSVCAISSVLKLHDDVDFFSHL